MVAGGQGNDRGMDQPYGDIPDEGGIDGFPAGNEPGSLDQVIAFFQFGDKGGYVLNAVLVVAVNCDDAFVSPLKCPPDAHPELGTLSAGVLFDEESIYFKLFQDRFFSAAVCGSAVTDDNIRHC